MKAFLFSMALIGWLALSSVKASAQTYEPYPYIPYGSGVPYGSEVPYGAYYPYPQQYDPYYDLHVMHYQLYLQQYPGYPVYQPCCFFGGPVWTPPVIVSPPRVIIAPRSRVFTFKRR